MQNNKVNQQQVDPPVKKKEVARYFVDLYRKAGKEISDEEAISFADSDIKWEIDYAHELLMLPKPSAQELDSIVGSFYDVAEVEKKIKSRRSTKLWNQYQRRYKIHLLRNQNLEDIRRILKHHH